MSINVTSYGSIVSPSLRGENNRSISYMLSAELCLNEAKRKETGWLHKHTNIY